MVYGYVSVLANSLQDVKNMILRYANERQLTVETIVEDDKLNTINWKKRELYNLIYRVAHSGDEVIVYEASNIGRSKAMIVDIFQVLSEKNISLHFVKYNKVFVPGFNINETDFIEIIQMIESDFISKDITAKLCEGAI